MTKSSKATATKAKRDKWDIIKHQIFCIAKEAIIRANQQPKEWKKFFAIYPSERANIQNLQGTKTYL